MSKDKYFNGWCCYDCLAWEANGELPPDMTEDEQDAWMAERHRRSKGGHWTLGRLAGEEGCEHTDDDWGASSDVQDEHAMECQTLDFSWSECDVCGSTLGGSRYAVTFWYD